MANEIFKWKFQVSGFVCPYVCMFVYLQKKLLKLFFKKELCLFDLKKLSTYIN